LETLILDGCPLLSFRGFPESHSVKHFSVRRTPVSQLPNFQILAVLCVGKSIQTLNGITVQPTEGNLSAGRVLTENFDRAALVDKLSEEKANEYAKAYGPVIRKGWISDCFPRKLNQAIESAEKMQNDPVAVQAVRLFSILKCEDAVICRFFTRLFAPTPEKTRVANPDIDERVAKQQALIRFMQDELVDIQVKQQAKLDALQRTGKTKKTEVDIPLSRNTTLAYEELLKLAAAELIANSNIVIETRATTGVKNPDGLRAAVAKLTKSDPHVGDRQLANLLVKLSHADDPDDPEPAL
jgi:hypothetical protein